MLSKTSAKQTARLCLAVIMLSCLGPGIAAAEFDYKSYLPYSIAGAIADHPHSQNLDRLIEVGNYKYRVTVTYTGQERKIKASVRDLLERWAKALRQDPGILSLFNHEIFVREGANEYWLPIQEPLLLPMAQELRPGDMVDLYIMRIGSTRTEWVFIVNEFEGHGPKN